MTRAPVPERVAIVGGGAAGTLLALQLSELGVPTTIFDRREAFGRGIAYGAKAPWHRLNVPLEKMGGWRADETDRAFEAWYLAQHGAISDFEGRYVPRSAFGRWLRRELDSLVTAGLVKLRGEEVIAIGNRNSVLHVDTAGGGALLARTGVLCLGNHKPRALPIAPGRRHVADIWEPGALDGIARTEPVLVVGSGSTGIDAILELHHRGHRGTIYLLSRRGLLPLVDAPATGRPLKHPLPDGHPRLSTLLRHLRREAELAMREGHSWQSVIDAFRRHFPSLWHGLSPADRARFQRHGRAYWLIHRHRLAPDIAELIDRLTREGRLIRVRGRLLGAQVGRDRVSVEIGQLGGRSSGLMVGAIINCTGPEEDFRRLDDPLVCHLLNAGMARPGPFGLGLDVDADARLIRADGTAHAQLFVLGGATRSRFGEVTSAPQIRRRAVQLAKVIAATLQVQR